MVQTVCGTGGGAEPEPFTLELWDAGGNVEAARFELDLSRTIRGGLTWEAFLCRYVQGVDLTEDELVAFGRDMFQAMIQESRLTEAWSGIRTAMGGRPVLLNLELGPYTELFAALPLELLHSETGFLFAKPGAGIRRSLLQTPMKPFTVPPTPRVLFAWARPPGSGDPFDPEPHVQALSAIFGERLAIIGDATQDAIGSELSEANPPFHYLHILAHGYRDEQIGGICLNTPSGSVDYVQAQRLAAAVQGRGLRLAFLCSCKTAVAGDFAFSGVGQQLLALDGGDLPCVVATQANLPVRASADLAGRFYRLLTERGDPALAISGARRDVYHAGDAAWSAPVLLSRPHAWKAAMKPIPGRGLPARRRTYLPRELEAGCLSALENHRFTALVGLPGIGKTETGKEAARAALDRGLFDRVIYQEILAGYTTDQLRGLMATALGHTSAESDEHLAALFDSQPDRILLVLDNAEDLMSDTRTETAFRNQINALLAYSPRLKILMTTRWMLENVDERPHSMEAPPMTPEETEELLAAELREGGTFRSEWTQSEAWRELVAFIDGHPRTLWLVAHHFDDRADALERVVARLRAFKEKAVVERGLLGRADAFEALRDDQRARLRSLVASMDYSFEILKKRHPDTAEVYMALSLFPSGLPDSVALAVSGGLESLALDPIYRYHLAVSMKGRTFYPVPLQWYADRLRKDTRLDESSYMRRALE